MTPAQWLAMIAMAAALVVVYVVLTEVRIRKIMEAGHE